LHVDAHLAVGAERHRHLVGDRLTDGGDVQIRGVPNRRIGRRDLNEPDPGRFGDGHVQHGRGDTR
jgi:hypothetical protein